MSSGTLWQRKQMIDAGITAASESMIQGRNETKRAIGVLHETGKTLDDLDQQFCKMTKLDPLDVAIMFVAIGLQIARQYLITSFPIRLDDQIAAKTTFGHTEEHSDRHHRYYNPSLEEILTNPVPFDANIGANGALSGGGKMGHRVTAIGHDPLLGLIFGTANIATSTITNSKMASYHVYTGTSRRDVFAHKARTDLVLGKTMDKLLSPGAEGKIIVAASLMKEVVHLRSDLNTKNSLPLPIVSAVDSRVASQLASYGLDMANVTAIAKQASYAALINTLIAMFHGLFSDATTEKQQRLFQLKTRKIISYSNLVASSSNLMVVAITQEFNKLDLGGLAVTVFRLINDITFIKSVKEEFIFGSYRDLILPK